MPNDAIYTTVGDLARFASFLMSQGPDRVLKTASLERFQMQSAAPADMGLTSGYGIGFRWTGAITTSPSDTAGPLPDTRRCSSSIARKESE